MRTIRLLVAIALLAACGLVRPAAAQSRIRDGWFTTTDGVSLHYLEAGSPAAHTIVLIPGWTMPAWIWGPQIVAFSTRYHVIAFDPRGQGLSEAPAGGYTPLRRGQDIAELLARQRAPVVLIGWSLGVLDSLAYIHQHGDADVAGLVLVDNSVGEEPAPVPHPAPWRRFPVSHEVAMAHFVRGMFDTPHSPEYLDRLTEASLRTPLFASRELLAYPEPRSYWRDAVYSTAKPLLYIVRQAFLAQAENLARGRPNTEAVEFTHAGHALFVDEPGRFNALVEDFIGHKVWP